ncbi:MAG: SEC59/DGK1/VTE5 family protein [Candidatus Aenigmarchaeota archaeon]|nr:SEC59/DGK1/VTE5 family protein [Candidatus Aenigmarchaeota archaeon]
MHVELKRQMVHASGILLILVLQLFGKTYSAIIFALGLAFFLMWGLMRKSNIRINGLSKIEDFIMCELKTYERQGEYFKGVVSYILGILLATILFPINITAACIAVLAGGDAFSTLIGKLYGRHHLPINNKKSWEGSIAFFTMTFFILMFFDPSKAWYIALGATFVEMLPKLDDNVTIPLAVGLLFSL